MASPFCLCVVSFVFIFITKCLKLSILKAEYETGISCGWCTEGVLCRETWQGSKKCRIEQGKEPYGLACSWGLAQFMACWGRTWSRGKEQVMGRYSSETFWPWARRISAMRAALCILYVLVVGCRGCGVITSWEKLACLLSKTVPQRRQVAVNLSSR